MMIPSSSASSRARAKLWLPPVSSNGLNRTRPMRWKARRPSTSSWPVRVGQADDLGLDLDDPAEVGLEDALQALAVLAAGDPLEASRIRPSAARGGRGRPGRRRAGRSARASGSPDRARSRV